MKGSWGQAAHGGESPPTRNTSSSGLQGPEAGLRGFLPAKDAEAAVNLMGRLAVARGWAASPECCIVLLWVACSQPGELSGQDAHTCTQMLVLY